MKVSTTSQCGQAVVLPNDINHTKHSKFRKNREKEKKRAHWIKVAVASEKGLLQSFNYPMQLCWRGNQSINLVIIEANEYNNWFLSFKTLTWKQNLACRTPQIVTESAHKSQIFLK